MLSFQYVLKPSLLRTISNGGRHTQNSPRRRPQRTLNDVCFVVTLQAKREQEDDGMEADADNEDESDDSDDSRSAKKRQKRKRKREKKSKKSKKRRRG